MINDDRIFIVVICGILVALISYLVATFIIAIIVPLHWTPLQIINKAAIVSFAMQALVTFLILRHFYKKGSSNGS